ncbi:MAG: tyrosine-type recombinase/integrase [bacterium]|nr:tyrosine-type recombinase/integrase [bacterium]
MPDVRSDEDCRRLIATLEKPVYRGCFTVIYAYGLRISEAVRLPVTAVDSKQMVLRVIGKGNKERAFPLIESILHMLQRGVDIRIIQILLGHSSLRSTQIYTHLTEALRDDLRQLLRQTTDGLFEGSMFCREAFTRSATTDCGTTPSDPW